MGINIALNVCLVCFGCEVYAGDEGRGKGKENVCEPTWSTTYYSTCKISVQNCRKELQMMEKILSFILTKNLLKDKQSERIKMEKIVSSVIQGGGSKSKTKTV